jgi:hypothetical protein
MEWSPVCDPDSRLTYYSACFAGCTERTVDKTAKVGFLGVFSKNGV